MIRLVRLLVLCSGPPPFRPALLFCAILVAKSCHRLCSFRLENSARSPLHPNSELLSSANRNLCEALAGLAGSTLIINDPQLPSPSSFEAVPIAWSANPLKFAPRHGFLVLANQTDAWWAQNQAYFSNVKPPLIVVDLYPRDRPYAEQRIVSWAVNFAPAAGVFMGGSQMSFFGFLFWSSFRFLNRVPRGRGARSGKARSVSARFRYRYGDLPRCPNMVDYLVPTETTLVEQYNNQRDGIRRRSQSVARA